jgi:hypothetical protein
MGFIIQYREKILYILLPGDCPGRDRCNLKIRGNILHRLPLSATSGRVNPFDSGRLNKF